MSKYRKNASIRVATGSEYDNTLRRHMDQRLRIGGCFLPPHTAIDTNEPYIVRNRAELNPLEVIYTLEMCDAAPDTMPAGVSGSPVVTGITRAAFLAAGWTDELLQAQGYVQVVVMVAPGGERAGPAATVPAAPAPKPDQPTLADLMREIQVLQRMVASSALCAHGAPLVRV